MKNVYLGKKNIGGLDFKTKTFSKRVFASRHLFRKLDAWGIDSELLNGILIPQGFNISITDVESDQTYKVSAEDFKKYGQYFHFRGQEDYRTQLFLPRSFWKVEVRDKDEELKNLAKLGIFG